MVWELKAIHYKFARFLKGAGTKSGMGKALAVAAKFSIAIQVEDLEVLIGATMKDLTEDGGGEHVAS